MLNPAGRMCQRLTCSLYGTCARVKPTKDLLPQVEVQGPQDAHNAPKPREGHEDEANLEAKLFWVLYSPRVIGQPARHAHTSTRTRTYTHMHAHAGLRVAYRRQRPQRRPEMGTRVRGFHRFSRYATSAGKRPNTSTRSRPDGHGQTGSAASLASGAHGRAERHAAH